MLRVRRVIALLLVALLAFLGAIGASPVHAAEPAPPVNAMAYSPDGKLLAVGTQDSRVLLYDPSSGALLRTLDSASTQPVTSLAFDPQGQVLAVGSRDSTITLWNPATGEQSRVLTGHEAAVRAVAFSPDGRTLVSGGEDSRVLLWNLGSGRAEAAITGIRDFVTAVATSPDGKRIAVASKDARIYLYDAASRAQQRTMSGHSAEITSIAFSADGTSLVSASADSTAKLWDVGAGVERRAFKGHTGALTGVGFALKGRAIVTSGEDGTVRVWNPVSGAEIGVLRNQQVPVRAVAVSPDGTSIAGGRRDGQVRTWSAATNQLQRSIDITAAPAPTPEPGTGTLTPQAQVGPTAASLSQGPGGPILVVTDATDPYSTYYAEILRTEGLNNFATADLSTVTAAGLASYDVVVLGAAALTSAQATTFSDWVGTGGNLIAMRPDADLAGLLGLAPSTGTLADGYLQVDTSRAPGNGIVGETIQFHGTADRYALAGARAVATLYSDATTATTNPAVTLRSVGTNGGEAAAFTYDLARSVVYSRQGNPAWSGQERDGYTPIRSDDLYFGATTKNPQRDWVDLSKVGIPQADEQQRLLANLVLTMNADRKPLPRFWYLPRGLNAAVVMTGDDHGNGGTAGRFDKFLADSPAGCSVADWECIRGTSYIYPSTPLTNNQAAAYDAQGFEVGLHVTTNCSDWTPTSLRSDYSSQLASFASKYTGIPAPTTNRTHCIVWSDWSTQATVERENNIRLDTNYYYWPSSWIQDRPGDFTGSAMPMRFADSTGAMTDVYQATSQMTDESGQTWPRTIDSLLDSANGPQGYYGVYTINAHTDTTDSVEADAVVASAKAHGVPVVTAKQMLTWLDGRNSSSFANLSWSANRLAFTVAPGAGARNLDMMIPTNSSTGSLASVTVDGVPASFTTRTIKGIRYAFVNATSGSYVATYSADTTAPTIGSTSPAAGATNVALSTAVTATASEALDPASVTGSTVRLLDPASNQVPATVSYDATSNSIRLAPTSSLAADTKYTATISGGGDGPAVTDLAGNRLAASVTWTFTTQSAPTGPFTIWPASATPATPSVSDPNAVELGVRFRSDVAGNVTGIRFWKGTQNTGTHTGSLWTTTGTRLASAVFSNETASGWQEVKFSTPVAITAGTTYVASYHTTSGNYAGDNDAFATAGVDNPPLHALRDGLDGADGVYAYSSTSTFPTQTWRSSNYWVDVVLDTGAPVADTTAPKVVSVSPVSGATGVGVSSGVSAVFDEAIDPATVSSSTV
ncbi:DUF4082 domain-containing protein, partial [Raineyella antarctica]